MDLSIVKTELKAWEREFKSKNGREPSKADIKANPEIAEKYRLYSKSRSDKSAKSQPAAAAAPPSTPSKRVAKHGDEATGNNGSDVFKTPSKRTAETSISAVNGQHSANGATQTANGHVVDANVADPGPQGQVQYVYAPSPSRLRALAASRSFSGSPNKKGGISHEQMKQASDNPVNLGKVLVLPPTIDTPRTKAKRWLAGDAVSPPVKLRYTHNHSGLSTDSRQSAPVASTSRAATASATVSAGRNGSKASRPGRGDFWQQVDQTRRSATPADDAGARTASHHPYEDDVVMQQQEEEDADVIAPSPAKPKVSGKMGKGKHRQRFDLFGSSVEESMPPAPDSSSRSLPECVVDNPRVITTKKPSTNLSVASFFSSKPAFAMSAEGGTSSSRPYVPGPSKAKKRAIASVALVPKVSEDFDKIDADEGPVAVESAAEEASGSRGKKAKAKGKGKAPPEASSAADGAVADRAKRLRTEVKQSSPPVSESDEDMHAHEEEALREMQEEEDLDTYDTRDLSDEYGAPSSRRTKSATPAVGEERSKSPSLALDESLDPELVSLLSLKASPVKNRLLKLHKKRETTYKALLQEPTYIRQKKKKIQGLEDLEDEEEDQYSAGHANPENSEWRRQTLDAARDTDAALPEEHSDDDWASEPEGWKDLSDGEMPEDSF